MLIDRLLVAEKGLIAIDFLDPDLTNSENHVSLADYSKFYPEKCVISFLNLSYGRVDFFKNNQI